MNLKNFPQNLNEKEAKKIWKSIMSEKYKTSKIVAGVTIYGSRYKQLAKIIEQHHKDFVKVARKIVTDGMEEDVVQKSYEYMCRRIKKKPKIINIEGYLIWIIKCRCLHHLRNEKKHKQKIIYMDNHQLEQIKNKKL